MSHAANYRQYDHYFHTNNLSLSLSFVFFVLLEHNKRAPYYDTHTHIHFYTFFEIISSANHKKYYHVIYHKKYYHVIA